MKKWLVLLLIATLALLGYVISGPYRTIHAIGRAAQAQDAHALSSQIDYPALRASLKLQLSDRLLRSAGSEAQANMLGAFGLRIAETLVDASVDAMVTPAGLAAIMEGRREWAHAAGGFRNPADEPAASDPLIGAQYRYQSPSRFTATLHDRNGQRTVFVVTRTALEWKLSDIRLPGEAGPE